MNEPRIECTNTRVFEVWKPRMKTQWNATGSVQRIASRPDQRWITFTGAPATIHGMTRFSRPKIRAAVVIWTSAKNPAADANHAFAAIVELNTAVTMSV